MTRPVTPNASVAELLDIESQVDRRGDPVLAVLRVEGRRLERALEVLALPCSLFRSRSMASVRPARLAGTRHYTLKIAGVGARGSRLGARGSGLGARGATSRGTCWIRAPNPESQPRSLQGRTDTHGLGMNSVPYKATA